MNTSGLREGKPIICSVIQEGVCVLGVIVAIKIFGPSFFGGDPSMCQRRASSRTMKAGRIIKIPQRIWDAYQIIRTTLPNFSMDWGEGGGGAGLISPPFQVVFEVRVQEQVHGKVENLNPSVACF